MEIHLTPEKEALLRELAARTGQDTAQVIQDAVDRLLDHDSWFREEVQKGQAEAARGNLISHEEVGKRIEKLHLCSVCNNITDVDPCSYCASPTRNQRLVCVIEEPTNIASIEKARFYNGVYHVLHGAISPLHGVGPEQLRIPSLLKRIESGSVDEVIIATNPTIEGEATAIHLSGLMKRPGLKVTRIATGIPAGSDIEYADEVTMLKAMEGRREL